MTDGRAHSPDRYRCLARARVAKAPLTVHMLTAVGMFGADLVLLTLGITSVLGGDAQTVYPAAAPIGRNLLGH